MANFFVTTPIYYPNDEPHIGNAFSTLQADAWARWHRLLGDDVLFCTGTDEHGLKMQRAADELGITPQENADRVSAKFHQAWDALNISEDVFIRTTEPRHYATVAKLMQAAYDNGWIYTDTYKGLYCVRCEAYYHAEELTPEGLCPVHLKPVEEMEEDNYFFKLSAFEEPLLRWYEDNPTAVGPPYRRNEALGLIRSGLEDVSISRSSISWGVPVPWDDKHVFYVWYDALINYATVAGYGSDQAAFDKWWPNVHHVIGKDIVRFHCVYWPALLMAAGIALPEQIAIHGFLLVGGQKISKSNATQIKPSDLVPHYGVDGYRYHFLRDVPFGPDGDFSIEAMTARYNADLANNLGNLLNRVTTVVGSKCGGVGPAPDPDSKLAAVVERAYTEAALAWDKPNPAEALEATWRIIKECNASLEAYEPWKAEPGAATDLVLGDALECLRVLAVLSAPAIPASCQEIWRRIGLAGSPLEQRLPEAAAWGGYPSGLSVLKGPPLFPRVKDVHI